MSKFIFFYVEICLDIVLFVVELDCLGVDYDEVEIMILLFNFK